MPWRPLLLLRCAVSFAKLRWMRLPPPTVLTTMHILYAAVDRAVEEAHVRCDNMG